MRAGNIVIVGLVVLLAEVAFAGEGTTYQIQQHSDGDQTVCDVLTLKHQSIDQTLGLLRTHQPVALCLLFAGSDDWSPLLRHADEFGTRLQHLCLIDLNHSEEALKPQASLAEFFWLQ